MQRRASRQVLQYPARYEVAIGFSVHKMLRNSLMYRSPPSCHTDRMRRFKRFFSLSGLCLVAAFGVFVTTEGPAEAMPGEITREELDVLEDEHADLVAQLQALEAAEDTVAKDLGVLERDLIAAAMESQRREEQATVSERKLISLTTRMSIARSELIEGEQALDGLMASLAVAGRSRPPALVSNPGDANAAIRASILMSHVAPKVKSRTEALTKDIQAMRKLERQIKREQAQLKTSEAALDLKKAEIIQMTAAKRAAFEDVSGDTAALKDRVTLLAREADTIRGLLAAIEDAAPDAPALKPRLQYAALPGTITDAPPGRVVSPDLRPLGQAQIGALGKPASGRLIRAWGEKMPGGTKSEGVFIATRADAQVSAPIDGKIEFAGPFRTYGELLIISTSDGYHILLSGMATSYVSVGQSVKRGEPVARMANRANPDPELYMEVRKSGTPMNPAKWMSRG